MSPRYAGEASFEHERRALARAVGDIGRRRRRRVDQPGAAVAGQMRLHAEIPLVAVPGLMHRGVARLPGVLGRGRRRDDPRFREDRIDNRAGREPEPVLGQMPRHRIEQPPAEIVRREPVAQAACRRFVGHRLAPEIDPDKRRIAGQA